MRKTIITITLFITLSLIVTGCSLFGDLDQEGTTDIYKLGFLVENADQKEGEVIRIRLDYDSPQYELFSYTIPDSYDEHSIKFFLSETGEFFDFQQIGALIITNILIWWDIDNDGYINSSELGHSESLYVRTITYTNTAVAINLNSFQDNNGVVLFDVHNLFKAEQ